MFMFTFVVVSRPLRNLNARPADPLDQTTDDDVDTLSEEADSETEGIMLSSFSRML